MNIFGIDPGPGESGWVLFNGTTVLDSGVADNHDLLRWVQAGQSCKYLAIEKMEGFGMELGASTIGTLVWSGRFAQAWREPESVLWITRRQVRRCMTGNASTKMGDSEVRRACIDLLGEPGVKRKPGPTYGVRSHAWSALAVAVTALEQLGIRVDPKQTQLIPAAP